jgi:non-specific serine/threonine protein kinase
MPDGRGFILRERLGVGGFGVVYRAYQPDLDREVAVKVIHPAISSDPAFREVFETEARVIARLEHPHIVPLYSYGQDDDGAWLVMRLLRGGSLADALARGPWRPETTARLLEQVAGALGVAHRHGVVHRDIKPDNILLGSDGSAFLADFGIAFDTFTSEPGDAQGPASPTYMAPEQVRGEPVSEATDVYSLGLVLFEALTGHLPWAGDPLPQILRRQLSEPLPDLTQMRPDLPVELGGVLRRATVKSPKQRCSLEELTESFAAATASGEGVAGPSSPCVPEPPGSVVGRDTEVGELLVLLEANRVVTLTGVGGVGKSTLGFEVARRLADRFADGVLVARLGTVIDRQRVGDAVAGAIGVTSHPREDAVIRIRAALRSKETLVVVDGCEQVVGAVAGLVEEILPKAPGVRFLVTSRERLDIPAEAVFSVSPLGVPPASVTEADRLTGFPAVRLFVDRAGAARRGFTLTARNAAVVGGICRHLDGIPLAIELAAARLRVLTPHQISDRLTDRFSLLTGGARTAVPQQRTLQAAIDWSHQLLDASEKELFRRLSVFLGGCTLEAAEQVCAGNGIDAADMLDLICALVDKSLLTTTEAAGDVRYGMLETIHEYASQRLHDRRDGEGWRRRHADYYARLAETGCEMIASRDSDHRAAGVLRLEPSDSDWASWLDRLSEEHDNLRVALRYGLSAGAAPLAGRIGAAAWTFWKIRGHIAEGRDWLERILEGSDGLEPAVLTEVLIGAAELAVDQGDMRAGQGYLDRALALVSTHSDARYVATITAKLASLPHKAGDLRAAVALKQEALAAARAAGDDWILGGVLSDLALLLEDLGDHRRAALLAEEAVELARRSANPYLIADATLSAGEIALNREDFEAARRLFEDASSHAETVGFGVIGAWALAYQGKLALATGVPQQARSLLERSLENFKELDYPIGASWALCHLGRALQAEHDFVAARGHLEQALELAQEYVRPDAPIALQALGILAADVGDNERGVVLLGAAEGLRRRFGLALAPPDQRESDEAWALLSDRVGAGRTDELAEHGRSMTVDDAVSFALASR